MQLSQEQIDAVRRSGQDVCVVAGPGSGKTRVLVERFAWLVEEQRIDPGKILAITFTEKAARVMKQRLVQRFADRGAIREEVERAWMMTIDAFCTRLLREHAIEAGLPPDFSVLDEPAANRLRRDAAEAALDELFQERTEEMRRVLEALSLSTSDDARQTDLAASLIEVHEKMRLEGLRELPLMGAGGERNAWKEARRLAEAIGREPDWSHLHDWIANFLTLPGTLTRRHFEHVESFAANLQRKRKGKELVKELREEVLPRLKSQWIAEWNADVAELLRLSVARLDQKYREAKRTEAAVDFADLGEKTIELLESDARLRERIVGRFEHLLMDELQDTNRLQWRLVELLRRPGRFFAVGDINQSIYGFRHADREVFQTYREEVSASGGAIDELKENYRSQKAILATVKAALAEAQGVEGHELVAKLSEEAAREPVVECVVASGERAVEEEAELVAGRIAYWKASEGRRWGDFAILVRALASAEAFERALDRRGIPFAVSGGRRFLETRETVDVLNLLAALVNPRDEIATAGVLRGPLVGWTDDELLRAGTEGRLREIENLFGRSRRLAGFAAPDRIVASILDRCGYVGALTERARANVEKLLAWLRRAHAARPRPLAELLVELEALRKAEAEPEAPPQQALNSVNIMTIHSAKGLEFPVVFVGALNRPGKQGSPVLLLSRELGLGAKWRNPAGGDYIKDAAHTELSEKLKRHEKEEEERLLFVAMTRAEDRLVLSYARQGNRPGMSKYVEKVFPNPSSERAPEEEAARDSRSAPGEPVLLDRPRVSGQHDSSAAVTDVALFAACPRKYFLARYVGLQPEPAGPGTGAIELGLEVHRVMSGMGQAAGSAEALEMKRRFDASELGQRMARAERVEREFDFLLAIEDVVLRGQIDAWFEESGELVVLDYKTDRDEAGVDGYSLQLRLYALALERYAGKVADRAALCFLRSGNVAEVRLRSEDLEEARGRVRQLAAAQESLEFPMKVGEQCRRCWFFGGLCPARLEEGT